VAAHEQHDQAVVLIGNLSRGPLERRQFLALPAGPFAPPLVDQAEAGGPQQPTAWIRRDPVARPVLGGREERRLNRVLGRIEVAGSTRERTQDLRRQLAQQVLESGLNVQRALPTCSKNPSISLKFEGA
jgi:hypothetical protein